MTPQLQNDGTRLRKMRAGEDERLMYYYSCLYARLLADDVPLLQCPEEYVRCVPALQCDIAIAKAAAAGDAQAVRALFAHWQESDALNDGQRLSLSVGRLCFETLQGADRGTLDTLLTKPVRQYMHATRKTPHTIATQYSLALLRDGSPLVAADHLRMFEKMARRYPFRLFIEDGRSIIRQAKLRADAGEGARAAQDAPSNADASA